MDDRPQATRPLEYGRESPTRRSKAPVVGVAIVLVLVLGYAWVMDSLHRRRNWDRRPMCFARNMLSITQALRQYASDHGGAFPNDLGQLVIAKYITDSSYFVCPASGNKPARGSILEIAAAVASGRNCDYVYVGNGLRLIDPPDTLLLYEPLGAHDNSWAFIERLDGTGDQLNAAELQRLTSARSQSATVKRSEPGKSTDQ